MGRRRHHVSAAPTGLRLPWPTSEVTTHRPVATALTAVALVPALTLTGCATDQPAPEGPAADVAQVTLGHVHGVGVDPGNGALYIASHLGVFHVSEGGRPERVADRWQDTMGFAIVGPGHFLGSGHPDLRENLPASLGLIESTDGANAWTPLSLQGEADFLAIEPVGDRIYAYDSHSGSLLASDDKVTWDTISRQPIYDLAADTNDPNTVYATTTRGALVASTDGAEPRPVPGAPVLSAIDWQPGGPLIGVAPDGTIFISTDTTTWRTAGAVDGPAEALDASPGRWHAATRSGVYESTDDGLTWRLVVQNQS